MECASLVERRSALWSTIGQRLSTDVHQVVEFAKRIPGFFSLPQDDQLILIKVNGYLNNTVLSIKLCFIL